ncbi:hypothetical protein BDV06DRAFT_227044 [Aspergillus oleicola]
MADAKNTKLPQETSVADLDVPTVLNALPLPPHEPADGVLSPLLHTEQWRQMYIDTVQHVCQRQADAIVFVAENDNDTELEVGVACNSHHDRDQDHKPIPISPCNELALFLKYAQGVVYVDLRHSGIAPFTPALSIGFQGRGTRRTWP